MKIIGPVRLGKDADLRYTPGGDAVASFSAAFNYGKPDSEGNRPSQWIEFSLWGKRAETLQKYLLKGKQFVVYARDPYIHTYEKKDGGTGFTLKATIDDIDFIGKRDELEQERRIEPEPTKQKLEPVSGGVDEFHDDIHF